MRRKLLVSILTAAVISMAATGCGSNAGNENGATAQTSQTAAISEPGKSKVDLEAIDPSEYIIIPSDYSKLDIAGNGNGEQKVTDEKVEQELNSYSTYLTTFEEITDRDTVQAGDYVNIDFVGKCDGKEFAGGSATGYDLEIGSGNFIEGFEDQLIGAKKGDTVEIKCTFPAEYFEQELAGKEAVFTTTVNKIEKPVEPELTDENVASLGLTDSDGAPIDTVDKLRNFVRKYLTEQEAYYEQYELRDTAVKELVKATEIKKEYPDDVIEAGVDKLIEMYGVSDETATGEYRESLKANAKDYITTKLAVKAVAKKEKIEVSDTDVEEYLKSMLGGAVSLENFSKEEIESYRELVLQEKVADVILKGKGITN